MPTTSSLFAGGSSGGALVPGYQKGAYISPWIDPVQTSTFDVNYGIMVTPLVIREDTTVDRITAAVSGPVAGFKLGIYRQDLSTSPASLGALVVEGTGTATTASLGEVSVTPTALSAGTYWLVVSPEGNATSGGFKRGTVDNSNENQVSLASGPGVLDRLTTSDYYYEITNKNASTSLETDSDVTAPRSAVSHVTMSTSDNKLFYTSAGDTVYEVELTSPSDIKTNKFLGNTFTYAAAGSMRGIKFSATGNKMFVIGTAGTAVYEFALGTNFDVTTASFTTSFGVSSQDTDPQDLAFSATGNKMFVVGTHSGRVHEYQLSTDFDLSTASYSGSSFSVSGQSSRPATVNFSATGNKMFISDLGQTSIHTYTLGTNFTISTAAFSVSNTLDSTQVSGVAFNSAGSKVYAGEGGTPERPLKEYPLGTNFTISTASESTFSMPSLVSLQGSARNLTISSDGLKAYAMSGGLYSVYEIELGVANDFSTVTSIRSLFLRSFFGGSTVSSLCFSSAGDKMYVATNNAQLEEFTLSTNFSLSSLSHIGRGSLNTDSPLQTSISSDGVYIFYMDGTSTLHRSTFGIPHTASTLGSPVSQDLGLPNNSGGSIQINSDGSKLFVGIKATGTGGDVYEYTLSTNYDITTTSFTGRFQVDYLDRGGNDVRGWTFSSDGNCLCHWYQTPFRVRRYDLATANDIKLNVTTGMRLNKTFSGTIPSEQGIRIG